MIFLHSSFRASSTWLWSRFRRSDRVIAYCEVFNETLASISRSQLNNVRHDSWHSKHPADAGYFLEFLPLLKEDGGVNGFDAAMSFARFIPSGNPDGAISEAERAYLAGLIAHAGGLGKIPVLSATRSLGRLRAIKQAFPGLHILIYRNLFQQWCSYTEQCFHNNAYFLYTIRRIVTENQHEQFFKYLSDLFPLGDPALDSTNYFYCFTLLHLYLYAQMAGAADLIIDINRLSHDAVYRGSIERRIADENGVEIDLSNARNSIAFSFVALGEREELMTQLKAVADLVISTAPSPEGRALASRALSELIEEYGRYHFYAGQLAQVAGTHGLLGERDHLRTQRDSLTAERERLRGERDGLAAERDGLRTERDRLITERDGLCAGLDRLKAEQGDLRAERDCLMAARDGLRAERDNLVAERAALLRSTSWRLTAPVRVVRNLLRNRPGARRDVAVI